MFLMFFLFFFKNVIIFLLSYRYFFYNYVVESDVAVQN